MPVGGVLQENHGKSVWRMLRHACVPFATLADETEPLERTHFSAKTPSLIWTPGASFVLGQARQHQGGSMSTPAWMRFTRNFPKQPVVLDLGCGPFTGGLALAGAIGQGADFDYVGVDRSSAMREFGEILAAGASLDGVRRTWSSDLSSVHWPSPPGSGKTVLAVQRAGMVAKGLETALYEPTLLIGTYIRSLTASLPAGASDVGAFRLSKRLSKSGNTSL